MQDFLDKTGTPGHGVPYEGEVKYGDRRRALLERRSQAAERTVATALQHHVPAADHGAHPEDCSRGWGHELEVLIPVL